jgi:hypothetical protein
MPGKRYNLRILSGPYVGKHARLIAASQFLANAALIEVQGETTFDSQPLTVDLHWESLELIKQKSTRRNQPTPTWARPTTERSAAQ